MTTKTMLSFCLSIMMVKPIMTIKKIDVTNKCVRQIGTYQYSAGICIEKTVPAVVIE